MSAEPDTLVLLLNLGPHRPLGWGTTPLYFEEGSLRDSAMIPDSGSRTTLLAPLPMRQRDSGGDLAGKGRRAGGGRRRLKFKEFWVSGKRRRFRGFWV
ncbi:unnamed protein product [Linum trigynum]|uniref:Uncharacterized protein n=1 Tax=Linum trigynum TaxID=586398 RepID=A0AAV2E7U0_9ROSI